MAVYPTALSKISEVSGEPLIGFDGQKLKYWAQDKSLSRDKYIIAIKQGIEETDGENYKIPAYDFIEKVADAVVLDDAEFTAALKDSNISTIYIGKDITLNENNVELASDSHKKVILGIHNRLNLNGKTIKLNGISFYAYCQVTGTGTFLGDGFIWLKDIITHNNAYPISAPNIQYYKNRCYERCIEDDFVTYHDLKNPTDESKPHWRQLFMDNTFPYRSIQQYIDTVVQYEASLRAAEDTSINNRITAEESARYNADQAEAQARATEDTRLEGLIEAEVTRATTAEATEVTNRNTAITNAINTEVTNRNTAISNAINTEVTNRNTAISNAISQEVSDRNDAITAAIHTVYKPKGKTTKAQLETVAFKASEDKLGFVYNFRSNTAGNREVVNTYSSDGSRLEIELEDNEDVAVIQDPNDSTKYIWNDFGGKIDLSNYYTKSKVDEKIAAATTTITNNGKNTTVSSTTAADNSKVYTINSEKTTVSAVTNCGLKAPSPTRDATTYITNYVFDLDLANADDVTACVALFNNL